MMKRICFLALCVAAVGCRPLSQGGQVGRYDFAHPDQVWDLPAELNEVSGNAFMAENGHLMLVQDEQLGLYEFDPQTGRVVGTRSFGRPADIEGVTRRNGTWYMLESNGVLWEVLGDSLRPIQTPFGAANNTEGLTYDARHVRFLIALKGEPARPLPDHRAVHSYDLASGTAAPFLDIDLRAISETQVGALRLADLSPKRAKKNGRPAKSKLPQLFEPSAIAYDSVGGHSYLLSAKSALVAVYDSNAALRGVHALPSDIFPKAEGICFGKKGALYISSEAKNGIPAHLAVFFPKR
jgi:uncharacterized protein YjiK